MRRVQDRSITRANRKKYKQEERLDAKTVGGVNDPTPAAATNRIIRRENRQ